MVAKMSPPLCDRSGIAGTGALEELVPDDRLLQREQDQSQNKKRGSTTGKQENNSPTSNKGGISILFFLTLDQGHHSTS